MPEETAAYRMKGKKATRFRLATLLPLAPLTMLSIWINC